MLDLPMAGNPTLTGYDQYATYSAVGSVVKFADDPVTGQTWDADPVIPILFDTIGVHDASDRHWLACVAICGSNAGDRIIQQVEKIEPV
jgi:hypothetical protein